MDTDGIKKVLQAYFDTGYEADGDGMEEVFHDAAHLYFVGEDGALADWDKSFFIDIVNNTKTGYPRYDEILSIEFTSEDTAVAKVKMRVTDTVYTDILSFIRLDGRWWIISKLFTGVPAE